MKSNISIFTPVAHRMMDSQTDTIRFHADYFLECLFLFDKVCINSVRLREIPFIEELIGLDSLVELIENGSIEFFCDAKTLFNYLEAKTTPEQRTNLLFSPGYMAIADRKKYLHSCLLALSPLKYKLEKQKFQELKLFLALNAKKFPEGEKHSDESSRVVDDLKNHKPFIKKIILRRAKKRFFELKDISEEQLNISIEEPNENIFSVKTDLKKLVDYLTPHQEYDFLNRCLLEVCGLEQSMFMRKELCMPIQLQDKQAELVDLKYSEMINNLDQKSRIEKFHKILQIKGLPSFEEAFKSGKLNIKKLLEIRARDEAVAFRQLFFSNENLDVEELCRNAEKKLQKISDAFDSGSSKALRFAIGSIFGHISELVGLTTGFADFATGLKIKSDPVTCFLNNELPSLFEPISNDNPQIIKPF